MPLVVAILPGEINHIIMRVVGPILGAQIEAISIIDAKNFWITSEETKTYNAFLAKIELQ